MYWMIAIVFIFWIAVFLIIRMNTKTKELAYSEYDLEVRRQLLLEFFGSDKFEQLRQAFDHQDYYDLTWKSNVLSDFGITEDEFDIWRSFGHGAERFHISRVPIDTRTSELIKMTAQKR